MTARTYRPRRTPLAGGGTLALRSNGSIEQLDEAGTVVASWAPDDPLWPSRAIRFGLHVTPKTVHPSGRDVPGTKPPV